MKLANLLNRGTGWLGVFTLSFLIPLPALSQTSQAFRADSTANGTVVLPSGISISQDGQQVTFPGITVSSNYSTLTTNMNLNGTIIRPDGWTFYPNSTTIAPTGLVYHPNGTTIAPTGFVVLPNGTTINPAGQVIRGDLATGVPDTTNTQ